MGAPDINAIGTPQMMDGSFIEPAMALPGVTTPLLSSTRQVPKFMSLSLLVTVTCHSRTEESNTESITASTERALAEDT